VSRSEARHLGLTGRIRYFQGDFVKIAPSLPPADIVTLDRVICCYDEMEALVSASAARASRLYGVVFPRSSWWVRLGTALVNVTLWIRRNPFRIFSHPTQRVEAVIASQGLSRVYRKTAGMWQVAVFARPA
jgi:magnesium-protoporphyrin O-methyltransferase